MDDNRVPVSVIVLTYNEEANIEACLQSAARLAGELFVVDSGSTDRTLEMAQRYTTNIVKHPFESYSRQRNWAQEELPLSFDWVFHIDADERISANLRSEVENVFSSGDYQEYDGFMVRRRIEFMGRWIKHGGIYPTYHLRLFRAACGRCEDREYDQHFIVDGGKVRTLEADLVEDTATDLASWTERHNRWAGLEARHLVRGDPSRKSDRVQGDWSGSPIERRRWWRASVYEEAPLFWRAIAYFLYRYILRGGFLDGTEGLIYHVLQGFWYRFYADARAYELKRKSRR